MEVDTTSLCAITTEDWYLANIGGEVLWFLRMRLNGGARSASKINLAFEQLSNSTYIRVRLPDNEELRDGA